MTKPVQIAVHDGPLHADDVMAAALLMMVHDNATVIRTRDDALLAAADLRADVGGRSDPTTGDYDHHFRDAPRRENGWTYAACGAVWKVWGEAIMERIGSSDKSGDAKLLDEKLFEGLDKTDTGEGHREGIWGDASSALWHENMTWKEMEGLTPEEQRVEENKRFNHALTWIRPILTGCLVEVSMGKTTLEKEEAVTCALLDMIATGGPRLAAHKLAQREAEQAIRDAVRQSGDGVVELPAGMPWQTIVHRIEQEEGKRLTHVVEATGSGVWMVTAVATESGGFVSRTPFPEVWGGARGEELERKSGLEDAVFCHPGLWISGWKTKDAAIVAAKRALRTQTERDLKR